MEGIADSLDKVSSPEREEWIKGLQLFFAEGEERYPEILLGVQTAQSILEDRLEIRILTPQDELFKPPCYKKDLQKGLTFEKRVDKMGITLNRFNPILK